MIFIGDPRLFPQHHIAIIKLLKDNLIACFSNYYRFSLNVFLSTYFALIFQMTSRNLILSERKADNYSPMHTLSYLCFIQPVRK